MESFNLLEIANTSTRLKMYPFFDMAHYIYSTISIREDIYQTHSSGSPNFPKKHPLSCWFATMFTCFAGGMLANFLLGEPIVSVFEEHQHVALATLIWYLVFYSPFDFFYKLCKFYPIKLVIGMMKEVQRCKKVSDGVKHAMDIYPDSYIIAVLVGTAKGAGTGIVKNVQRLITGIWIPTANEALQPSFPTKLCFYGSVVFILQKKGIFFDVHENLFYLGVMAFFIYFKLSSLIMHIHDPAAPFENLCSTVLFGGMLDALKRARTPRPAGKEKPAGATGDGSMSNLDKSKDAKKKE